MSAHVYVESSCCAEEATMPRARLWLWLCSTVCLTALVLASPYEGEDDDFVSDMHKQSGARCWSAVIA